MTNAIAVPIKRIQDIKSVTIAFFASLAILTQTINLEAHGAQNSFADLIEEVGPSVVNITTKTIVERPQAGPSAPNFPNLPQGTPFDDFFQDFFERNMPNIPQNAPPRSSSALGSGFVISEDGYIVTNNHVIEGANEIEVEFLEGQRLPAEIVGTDPKTDIAVLKVESDEPLPYVEFGDSSKARMGDWVVAMGNPLGQGFSASAGIVSQRGRALSGIYDDFIQTDAAINRGNSGGPLFNMDGDVIGVNTAILSPTGGSIGIGFSMASDVVTKVVEQLVEFGETRRGWLGVRIQDVSEDVAEAMNLQSTSGALITDVPEGPAKEAGIEAGDIILSFDGVDITDTNELVRTVGDAPVGKAVRVTVYRDGATKTLLVTLGRRELAENTAFNPESPLEAPAPVENETIYGMQLQPITEELKQQFVLPENSTGLVITEIDGSSAAFEKGLRVGDVIVEVSQSPVQNVAKLKELFESAKAADRRTALLLIKRGEDSRFLALEVNQE